MLENVKEVFERLGLKEPEVKVYFTCLENRQGLFVAEITKLTGIKRSTVNLVLERLAKKGFITFHLDGNRKLFSAESPETLFFQFEDSLNDLRHLIPLLRIAAGSDKKTNIRFFEGREGVEKILSDVLITLKLAKGNRKELLEISSGQDVFDIQPDHRRKFIDRRVKERIPLRWISPESPLARTLDKTSKSEFRKIKFFNNKTYRFQIEIDIYADKIALIDLGRNPSGVIVENKLLTDSFRSLFNLLWDHLK